MKVTLSRLICWGTFGLLGTWELKSNFAMFDMKAITCLVRAVITKLYFLPLYFQSIRSMLEFINYYLEHVDEQISCFYLMDPFPWSLGIQFVITFSLNTTYCRKLKMFFYCFQIKCMLKLNTLRTVSCDPYTILSNGRFFSLTFHFQNGLQFAWCQVFAFNFCFRILCYFTPNGRLGSV